jgi:hypothetical protein
MDKIKLKEFFDVVILRHGFTEYNRDYDFLLEMDLANHSGKHILRFKHVYELQYLTSLGNETLNVSTDDNFINFKKWEENGAKGGYVWGVNYCLAYPGFSVIDESEKAEKWTKILSFEMFHVTLETEAYKIEFIAKDFELIQLDEKRDSISTPFIVFD